MAEIPPKMIINSKQNEAEVIRSMIYFSEHQQSTLFFAGTRKTDLTLSGFIFHW